MDELIFNELMMDDLIFFNGMDWMTLVNSLENMEEANKIQSFITE